jgi:predicted GH43/DUF377 family glycosyl hydrolase
MCIILLTLPSATALDVDVKTAIPEYIMDDYLNLTGTTDPTTANWTDNADGDFNKGSTVNVTTIEDSVLLRPELDFQILNNGNPVLSHGTGTEWDKIMFRQAVVKVGAKYYMYYVGCTAYAYGVPRHIGLATSTDGINFTKHTSNPILRATSYDKLAWPVVLKDGPLWRMYYGGMTETGGTTYSDVCYAYSSDGENWTKYASNPVISRGSPITAHDGRSIQPSSVFKEGSNSYRLYYRARGSGTPNYVALATSTDGVNWTKHPSNPLRKGDTNSWEQGWFIYTTLEKSNGTYRIWSTGDDHPKKTGYSTSSDGLNWTDSGKPVVSPKAGTFYSDEVTDPIVIDEGDYYTMFFRGENGYLNFNFGAFKVKPLKVNGSYVSRQFDAGGVVRLDNVIWDSEVPSGGDLNLYLRWANTTTGFTPWTQLDKLERVANVTARYFQYKALFRAHKDWFQVRLNEVIINYTILVDKVEVNIDGGSWQSVNGSASNWYSNLSLTDGDYDVQVRVTDNVGDQVIDTIPVKVDLYLPTGNITLEQGRAATNSTTVYIDLQANDTHGPIEVQLARQPDFPGATWWPIVSTYYGMLGDPYGPITVYARYRDAAGRISETYNDTIIIDTKPPTGTLLINDGATYTNSTYVDLNITWDDITGIVAMMISTDPMFQGAIWEDPRNRISGLIGDTDGIQRIYVRIMDGVGWETTLSDDIILDRTPPAASMSINDGDEFTTTSDVTLGISLDDVNPVSFKLANIGDDWPIAWRTAESPTEVLWTVASGLDGPRTVRLLVRDAARNEIVVTDGIVLDTTAPVGELLLNDGAPFTNAILVQVHLNASDDTSGLDKMRVSSTDDFTDITWQSVKSEFDWALNPGDGTKNVIVQLRDLAGLTTTIDASIILDTSNPEGSFTINSGDKYALDTAVSLVLEVTDAFGLSEVRASNDPGFSSSTWVTYSSTIPWTLDETIGESKVFVEVMDMAGNSIVMTDTIIKDLSDPEVSVLINEDAEATLNLTVDLVWTVSDDNMLLEVGFSEDPSFSEAEWVSLDGFPFVPPTTQEFTFSGGDGFKTIYVRVRDASGRTGTGSDDIWYVSSRPEGTMVLGDGSGWTNTSNPEITVAWTGGSVASHFRTSWTEKGLSSEDWLPIGSYPGLGLVPMEPDGPKTVYIELLGPHNVTSLPWSQEIVLDTMAPTVEFLSPLRNRVSSDRVTFNISVHDGLDPEPGLWWRLDGGEFVPLTERSFQVDLREGDHTVEVMAVDAAGNSVIAPWDITREDTLGVSTGSILLIVLIVVVVLAAVGLWVWNRKRTDGGGVIEEP